MATDLTLINAALTRTGSNPLTNLTSGSATAAVAAANYEKIIEDALAAYPWKFATKISQLTLLDPDVHGDPPEPWLSAYQRPTDMLDVRTIMVGGLPILYAVHSDKILCDAGSDSEVIAHYLWRVTEPAMPAWFQNAIIIKLEGLFLRAVGERYREADARDVAADQALAIARLRDTQGQPSRPAISSPTLRARSGYIGRPCDSMSWRR